MKNKNQIKLPLVLAGMALFSSANATVVSNIDSAMGTLLGHPLKVTNINDIQSLKLEKAQTQFQPWTGSYWPDLNGGITNHYRIHGKGGAKVNFGLRYGVGKARFASDHQAVLDHVSANPNETDWTNTRMNQHLSPSEKYDLLLGDMNFTFTQAIMDETDFRADHRVTLKKKKGEEDVDQYEDNQTMTPAAQAIEDSKLLSSYRVDELNPDGSSKAYSPYEKDDLYRYWRNKGGSLAYWSGICDGWGPASIYLPRPTKPVTVIGAKGHRITFYPDDIKALGSYLFARTNTPYFATMNYRYFGRKCDASAPMPVLNIDRGISTNDEGWIEDIRCNDMDPGVFHLALVNRVGVDRMGFLMDVDNNLKINNHPIAKYESTYFNPVTGEEGKMKDSIVPRSQLKDDIYAKRRHENTRYIIGVKTTVHYMYYVWPEENRNTRFDSERDDTMKSRDYVYDLELDGNGNILGGEWGNRSLDGLGLDGTKQPDFIWMADTTALPYSMSARYVDPGLKKDRNNPRPFGTMNWTWDGKSPLPQDWVAAAKLDEKTNLSTLQVGKVVTDDKGNEDVVPAAAKGAMLKSATPLSTIVYYLFDQARNSAQN